MKILYLHGFGSFFDPESDKIRSLGKLGTVVGVDIDYNLGSMAVSDRLGRVILNEKPDLLVGTSLGGYWAACLGEQWGITFVALNPSIRPSESLLRYVGTKDFRGNDITLTATQVALYPKMYTGGNGLVIVESGDKVLDPVKTLQYCHHNFLTMSFAGGSHRFEQTEKALPFIEQFYNSTETSYGV